MTASVKEPLVTLEPGALPKCLTCGNPAPFCGPDTTYTPRTFFRVPRCGAHKGPDAKRVYRHQLTPDGRWTGLYVRAQES